MRFLYTISKSCEKICARPGSNKANGGGAVKLGRLVRHQDVIILMACIAASILSSQGGQQALLVSHLSGCPALTEAAVWRVQRSQSKVPYVTLPGWLEGTLWQGMPYHVTLGLPEDWSLLPTNISRSCRA